MESKDNRPQSTFDMDLTEKRRTPSSSRRKVVIWTLVLAAILVAAVGIYFAATLAKDKADQEEEESTAQYRLTSGESESVDKMEIRYDGVTYNLVKQEGKWVVEGQENIALDQSVVDSMITNSVTLMASDVLSDVEDLSPYGVEELETTVTFIFGDGTSQALSIGEMTSDRMSYYVQRSGHRGYVYIVSKDVLAPYLVSVNDLRSMAPPEVDGDHVLSYKAVSPAGELAIQNIDSSEQGAMPYTHRIVSPITWDADALATDEVLGDAAALTPDKYVGETAESSYGLDQPTYSYELSDKDGALRKVTVGADAAELSTSETIYAYCTFEGMDGIYAIDKSKLAFLDKTAGDLAARSLSVSLGVITEVTVEGSGRSGTLVVTKQEVAAATPDASGSTGGNVSYTFTLNGGETDNLAAAEWLADVSDMTLGRQVEGEVEGEALLTLTYQLSEGPGTLTVEYIPHGMDACAVRVNGRAAFTVERSKVNELMEAWDALGA